MLGHSHQFGLRILSPMAMNLEGLCGQPPGSLKFFLTCYFLVRFCLFWSNWRYSCVHLCQNKSKYISLLLMQVNTTQYRLAKGRRSGRIFLGPFFAHLFCLSCADTQFMDLAAFWNCEWKCDKGSHLSCKWLSLGIGDDWPFRLEDVFHCEELSTQCGPESVKPHTHPLPEDSLFYLLTINIRASFTLTYHATDLSNLVQSEK